MIRKTAAITRKDQTENGMRWKTTMQKIGQTHTRHLKERRQEKAKGRIRRAKVLHLPEAPLPKAEGSSLTESSVQNAVLSFMTVHTAQCTGILANSSLLRIPLQDSITKHLSSHRNRQDRNMKRIGKTGEEKRIIGRSVARDPKEEEKGKERKANAVLFPVSDLESPEDEEKVPAAGLQDEVLGSLGLRPADAHILASLQISVNQARCTRTI